MDLNKNLDILQRMKKVDAPPFLLTRIKQQIHALQHTQAPPQWKWAFAFTAIVVLTFNISILSKLTNTINNKNNTVEIIVHSLSLSATKDLYNE